MHEAQMVFSLSVHRHLTQIEPLPILTYFNEYHPLIEMLTDDIFDFDTYHSIELASQCIGCRDLSLYGRTIRQC